MAKETIQIAQGNTADRDSVAKDSFLVFSINYK